MSDIRFEGWLHKTGTGGVYQDAAGNVGIASTQPQTRLDIGNGGFQVGPTGIATVTTVNTTNIINATQLSHRNLIINGAMLVAQRGTSSTSQDFQTVDRLKTVQTSIDEVASQAQVDVASGTTPYTLGFRKAFKLTNGNQTSGAGSGDVIKVQQRLEAQVIANSGWNYLSSSSYLTMSFWVKSSVAQNFYIQLIAYDNATYNYTFETGSLSADTWTKVTHSIPGNSNIRFDNDNGNGLEIGLYQFQGTDRTASDFALNTWAAYASGSQSPDMTSTWYTTNDATWEITGIQLEVGSVATPFEHRSFGDELQLCRRYYQVLVDQAGTSSQKSFAIACAYSSSSMHSTHLLSPEMRTTPTLDYTTGSNYYKAFYNGTSDFFDEFTLVGNSHVNAVDLMVSSGLSVTQGNAVLIRTQNAASKIAFTAEL